MNGLVKPRMVVWSGVSLATVLAGEIAPRTALPLLAAGVIVVLVVLSDSWPVRLLTAAALAPAGIPSAPAWAFLIAAAVVALPPPGRAPVYPSPAHDALQRHIDRARRRDERVHLLAVSAESPDAPSPEALAAAFRTTDSVSVRLADQHYEILAVVDDHKLERAGMERRLEQALPGTKTMGWAQFPGDGYSLAALAEHATSQLGETSSESAVLARGDVSGAGAW